VLRTLAVYLAALGACRSPDDSVPPPALETAPVAEPAPAALPELRKLWDFGDPAASEARFREAVEAARAAGDRDYEAEAWTQVARAQGLEKRFADAEATLAATEPLLREEAPAPRIRWKLEKGRTLNSSGRRDEAKPLFVAAWELARSAGNEPLAMDAAHMVAIAAPPEEALEWAHRSIAIAEASSDPRVRGWLGPLYNNTGWTHFGRGETDLAVGLWRKSVDFRVAEGDPKPTLIAWWTWARGLRAQGKLAEALEVQERLRRETEAAGAPDGYVHEEIAEILLAQGRRDEARAEFHRAWDLLRDADDVKGDAARAERLRTAAGMGEAAAPR